MPGMTSVEGKLEHEEHRRRQAAAEANSRQVNEAIERGHGQDDSAVFVCECAYFGCNTTIEMSIADYEAVRTNFDRFLLAPGHEVEEIEEVVERHADYFVVVKDEGTPKLVSSATDERAL
jgi:hypothetical protein